MNEWIVKAIFAGAMILVSLFFTAYFAEKRKRLDKEERMNWIKQFEHNLNGEGK